MSLEEIVECISLGNDNSSQEWAVTSAIEPVIRPLVADSKTASRVKRERKRLFIALDCIQIPCNVMEKDRIVGVSIRELIRTERMDPTDMAWVRRKMFIDDDF